MVLGTEHAAAVRRGPALADYLIKLDEAKRAALGLGLLEHASQIDQLIRSAQVACQDNQALVEMFERQESAREATRALRSHARAQFEQLLLNPQAQVL